MSISTPASAEDRAQRRQADREYTVKAIEALRTSEGWQAWLSSRRHFHRYSFANQLLIAMQCPEATYVAGFRAWLKLGYAVRKGERALRIWVPMQPSKAKLEAWRASGGDPNEKPQVWFKLGPVFDRSQVDPLPPPAEPAPLDCPIADVEGDDLGWARSSLIELATSIGSDVSFEAMPAERGGYYESGTRGIAINDNRSVNAQVKTLIHELAHALLRAQPADDDLDLSYAEEELVVESIAFTVCGSLGLDVSAYAIPYLASWAEEAQVETIQAAAALIDRHARSIENALTPPATEA